MPQLRALSNVLAKKAAAELNENSADIDIYLENLREWIAQQKFLRSRITDQFLIVFLRSSKYSLEKAKQRLKDFYTYRSRMPEIFLNRNVNCAKVKTIIQSGCILHLPHPTAADGARVIMIRPAYFNMDQHSIPDVFKVGSMATDILLYEDDNAIVAGYELIMDLANIPAAVLLNFDSNFAKKMTILANKISPTRMLGFHFLNVPSVFETLFNMVKNVINVKLRNRFYIHGSNYDSLYERIPRRILPREYGGDCDIASMQIYWLQKLRENRDFFEEEEGFGVIKDVDELNCRSSSRMLDTLDAKNETFFGVNGSFRQLNLD